MSVACVRLSRNCFLLALLIVIFVSELSANNGVHSLIIVVAIYTRYSPGASEATLKSTSPDQIP